MSKEDRYGPAGDTYGEATDPVRNNGRECRGDQDRRGNRDGSGRGAPSGRDRDEPTDSDGSDGGERPSDGLGELPFIFARRTVKADRDALPVYVRESTADDVDDLERELQGRFDGDDVMSLDVREAVVRAGLRNVDDVVDVMEEWGYGRR
ncbi:hypothetical protein [Halegenticoccus soli]|uniref:hypothetical protein n=1 Tax=Halegenticoccus soli TaxID=1985678 RepID=UPI000C6CAA88|nr:hypothetical protein [Halegenticoccus soli]